MADPILQQITVAGPEASPPVSDTKPLIEVAGLSLYYGAAKALNAINVQIRARVVTAFIGPSGCGKSTLLRCFNRMNDLIDHVRIEGAVRIGTHDIYSPSVNVIELRKRVGMVFQKSNPFPSRSTKTSRTACACTA